MQRLLGLLIVMLAIVTVFTSCDMRDQDLRGKVTFTEDSEGHRSLTYQDTTYYYDEKEFFSVTEDPHTIPDGDVMVGWNGMAIQWFYVHEYHSYTQDAPLFIYNIRPNDIYFRQDYDYRMDTFLLEGTDVAVVFSDAITEHRLGSIYQTEATITLRSQTDPRVVATLDLASYDGVWCVVTRRGHCYRITDQFKELLDQYDIISILDLRPDHFSNP